MEEWRPIKGFDGKYEVSSLGRVRSSGYSYETRNAYGKYINHKPGVILRPQKDKGYLKVCLYNNGKPLQKRVHRLVAEAFLNKDSVRKQVNHKNGNKHDNRVENLEWCTQAENVAHALRSGLISQKRVYRPRRLSYEDVVGIKKMKKDGFLGREIAHKYNITLNYVYDIAGGRVWKEIRLPEDSNEN